MAWPDDTSLPVCVWAAFGADLTQPPVTWNFTDLTARYKRLARTISIRGGGSDGAGEAAAGTGTVDLDNDDGELTPGHAASSLWPNVDLNTPVLIGVEKLTPKTDGDAWSTNSTNSLGVSDGGRTWIPISAGGTITTADFQATGGVATMSVPIANAYRAAYITLGAADVDVACSVSAPVTVAGAAIDSGLILRLQDITHYYLCRISVAVGGAITASINAFGGTGDLASGVVSGLTWSSGVALRIRAQAWGTWVRMKVWAAAGTEPTAWTLTTVDDQYTAAGGVGFRSGVASGNSNTKPIVFSHDNFTVTELPTILSDGYADGWKPTYLPTTDNEFVSSIQLTASGLFRRLGQGKSALRSAAYRAITPTNPDVYLPCESGQLAVLTSPGLASVASAGNLSYTADGLGVPVLSLGNASAPAVTAVLTGWTGLDFQIDWTARWAVGTTVGTRIFEWTTPGSLSVWRVSTATNGEMLIEAFDQITNTWIAMIEATVNNYDGEWAHYSLVADDNGVGVFTKLYINGTLVDSGSSLAVGRPINTISIMPVATTADVSIGHVAIWSVLPTTAPPWYAVLGHPGEAASDRIRRLCGEEGIPIYVKSGESEALDVQQPAGLLDILRAAARADMGILSEYMWGLRYRPRSRRTNISASMTIDLSTYRYPGEVRADTILTPAFDDQAKRNDWTVSRAGGSSARVVDEAHAAKYGTYDDSVELEVPDSRLVDHAGWRTWLGTWPGMRYADVPLHLHANPSLIPAWTALALGDRVDRINPPAQHPPGPISQIINGYSMTLTPKAWTVAMACAPYGPWEVSVAGGTRRYTAKGSTIGTGGISSSATSFLLTSTAANGVWVQGTTITRPTTFPLVMTLGGPGGEDVTVSGISGGTSPQTVTISARGINGIQRAWTAGTAANVRDRAITPL